MNSLSIVIFGATGNLYADKLAKALFLLFEKEKVLPKDFKIIAFGRKDFSDAEFRAFTLDAILKRGEINSTKLNNFLEHIIYFKGNFLEKNDFSRLKDSISPNTQVLLHIATAPELYEKIFENINLSGINIINDEVKILIEKPFGKDEVDAKRLQNILTKVFKDEQIFHVDHYLAKETAKRISNFRFDARGTEKIKIVFYESNVVGSRGASYDAVGAFRDVGQNHMLMLLVLMIMEKPNTDVRASRLKALSELSIDTGQKITRGQYVNYLSHPNIALNSETETFFRVFLKSKNPNFSNVEFELEGGKGLVDLHSNITTTTVAILLYFKNGENKEFKIQPVVGTVYESYTTVYNDALMGEQKNFPSIEEITLEWKFADELLEKWKDVPLVIYKQGSKAEDIN